MAHLSVYGAELSVTKKKAIEDAKRVQSIILERCNKEGIDPPEYTLSELIGKGSFGRVYKGASKKPPCRTVAIKIIDIEKADLEAPKFADTMADLVKEISALKRLAEGGAKNINVILDAFTLSASMWMITEYCAGGSVATLMKPTSPGGLQEKWIIPILREVAEAVHWVHKEGIVHRDIKCANILVTEAGGIQLCDFGVAGFVENRSDKRTTFIGTLHWMAPEFFDHGAYGTEVDVWAFGSMAYEVAKGWPPNADGNVNPSQMGQWLKTHQVRLEGDKYSDQLKSLIEFCLQVDPTKRPSIEQVQAHPYLAGSEEEYPMSSLSHLVRAYRLWEAQGGSRKSLFSAVGAQGPVRSYDDEYDVAPDNEDADWNFSTTDAFDEEVLAKPDQLEMYDVYGEDVFTDDTAKPTRFVGRRRVPPHLQQHDPPLAKLFDPNTTSSYEDNLKKFYNPELPAFKMPLMSVPPPSGQQPPPRPVRTSDLPLRNVSDDSSVRESLIDLDFSLGGDRLSKFVDLGTMRAQSQTDPPHDDAYAPPLSDPADLNANRRTQEWQLPSTVQPLTANPELPSYSLLDEQDKAFRPRPMHHQPEPMKVPSIQDLMAQAGNRASIGSLIDLDEGLVDSMPPRPSTSNSDVISLNGSDLGIANPFEFERHASLYYVPPTSAPSTTAMKDVPVREPSIYVSEDTDVAHNLQAAITHESNVDIPSGTDKYGLMSLPDPYQQYQLGDSNAQDFTQKRVYNSSLDINSTYQFPARGPTPASEAPASEYPAVLKAGSGGPGSSGYASDPELPPSMESSTHMYGHVREDAAFALGNAARSLGHGGTGDSGSSTWATSAGLGLGLSLAAGAGTVSGGAGAGRNMSPLLTNSSNGSNGSIGGVAVGPDAAPTSGFIGDGIMITSAVTQQQLQQQHRNNLSGAIPVPDGLSLPPVLPTQPPVEVMLGRASSDRVRDALRKSIDDFRTGLIHASQRMAELYHYQGSTAAHSAAPSRLRAPSNDHECIPEPPDQ